jgi:hypothetical protein
MTKLTLTILAQDILTTSYLNSHDCAITRALHRAGRTDLDDCGDIKHLPTNTYIVKTSQNESYFNLVNKVLGMYGTKTDESYTITDSNCDSVEVPQIPIEDFEHILIFEEPLQLQ